MNKKRGRPILYGLKVITRDRIKKSRIALASGSSRKQISEDIFKLSPRTFRRLLETDDPLSQALKRSVEEGELLQNEPLALLICMYLDQQDEERLKQALIDNQKLKEYLALDGRKSNEISTYNSQAKSLNEIATSLNLTLTKKAFLYKKLTEISVHRNRK